MQGVVHITTGSNYRVETADGKSFECKIKGNFRIKGIKTTNPIAVGDVVDFELLPDGKTGLISNIHERKNCIIRRSINLSHQSQIIATNIDRAFLVVSLFQPRTPFGFIDRFLVTAEAYFIPATIIFNKVDIYDEESMKLLEMATKMYTTIGYECRVTSALRGDGVAELKNSLAGKTSLFSGNSGVGKSALINAIDSKLQLKTGDISGYHQKGKHTTTFAEMHRLSNGGFIIDTPGIKEFGMVDFSKDEVALYFPEMKALLHECKFSNCTHVHEPGCAVKTAVSEHYIHPQRYKSYLNILSGKEMDIEAWELK
ncbi:MAG: ribosome small subunit-dependent GTPase A [Bacteroidales bacterium]|jgi:ribosome biogenesis GTPase|nr:ribosome small subunit-dependent GTPase A [Bacteroidales bacterium]